MPHKPHATNQENVFQKPKLSMKTETYSEKQHSISGLAGRSVLVSESPRMVHLRHRILTPAPPSPHKALRARCLPSRPHTQKCWNMTERSQNGTKDRGDDFRSALSGLLGIQATVQRLLESAVPHFLERSQQWQTTTAQNSPRDTG